MKLSISRVSASTIAAALLATVAALDVQRASAAYPDTCQVQFKVEDKPNPDNTLYVDSGIATLTTTETAHSVTIPANTNAMNSFLMYIKDENCPVEITSVVIDDDGSTNKTVEGWGTFGGTTVSGKKFEKPAGSQSWAGFANTTATLYPLAITSDATVTITGKVASQEVPAPAECEQGIHFEEAFGNAVYDGSDCANPTYTNPTGDQSWAGFADKIATEGAYPYQFSYGGKVDFTCSGGETIYFKFEKDAHPNVDPSIKSPDFTCSGAAQSWTIASSVNTYKNFLMYIKYDGSLPAGESAVVKGVAVTTDSAPSNDGDNGGSDDQSTVPVPAIPLGGLLGLIGLVGWLGLRRRG